MIVTQKEYYDFREEENTRQVSLYRLARSAAKRWKLILLAAVLVGCFMGGYKILSIHAKKAEMIEDYDNYQAKLTAYKASIKEYRKSIADYQKTIDAKSEYMENSPKMKLDAFSCPISSADVRVVPAGETKLKAEDITAIKQAVYNDVYFGDALTEIADKYGMSVKDIRELTTVKLSATTGTSLRLSVRGETEEQAEAMREDILAAMVKRSGTLAPSTGSFTLKPFNKGTVSIIDTEIQTYKDKQQDSLAKIQTAAYTAQNQSAQLVKPVAVPQYSKKYMLINGIKMGAAGFVIGAVLAMIAVIVLIVQKGVILSPEEIDGEYGLRTLADFSGGKPGKNGEELEYVIARIENCIADKKADKIGVVGTASEKRLGDLTKALNEKAREAGSFVSFSSVPGITKNAAALRKLSETGRLVLVEEVGKSDYYGVRKEIALIADSGRELLGTVYF